MKNLATLITCISLLVHLSCDKETSTPKEAENPPIEIPTMDISILTAANSWVYNNPEKTNSIIGDNGIKNWHQKETKIRTYFRVEKTGEIHLGIKAKVWSGSSKIIATFNGETKEITINSTDLSTVFIGTFNVEQVGYHFLELQGISTSSGQYAEITKVLMGGEATKGLNYFVKEDVYWGRRGPSVHLSYEKPVAASDIVWFYNEMTIPEGKDPIGSYFMASGFGEGYFGIQVNSATERRVLFSVWSAFTTDDPNQIPADYKVTKIANGNGVTVQDFGNEGSGLQSFKIFNWKAGNTYKFLLKAIPSENNSTDYTAYFYAAETGEWELISSLRRPKTTTYLKRPHSFLENFIPSMGDVTRKVEYSNQWVYDTSNTWHPISKATFTADATARKDARLDYAGGAENGHFFLENCGFFSERTAIDSQHQIELNNTPPAIDFENLPIQ